MIFASIFCLHGWLSCSFFLEVYIPTGTGNDGRSSSDPSIGLLCFLKLNLDFGPDPFVHVIDPDLCEKLEKANLEGNRSFPGDDLGNDDRRSAGDKPPCETLGEAPEVGVFPGFCHENSIGGIARGCRLSCHGRIVRRDCVEALAYLRIVVLVHRLPWRSSFQLSYFHGFGRESNQSNRSKSKFKRNRSIHPSNSNNYCCICLSSYLMAIGVGTVNASGRLYREKCWRAKSRKN